jgi:hypothetical protein
MIKISRGTVLQTIGRLAIPLEKTLDGFIIKCRPDLTYDIDPAELFFKRIDWAPDKLIIDLLRRTLIRTRGSTASYFQRFGI